MINTLIEHVAPRNIGVLLMAVTRLGGEKEQVTTECASKNTWSNWSSLRQDSSSRPYPRSMWTGSPCSTTPVESSSRTPTATSFST